MSNALKCPNPSCPYLFDASRVPPGVVLSCPRCGMRFTLGPSAATPQQTAPQQPPAPGYAAPPQPPPPPRSALEDLAGDDADAVVPRSRTRAPGRAAAKESGSDGLKTLVLVVVGIAMLGAVAVVVYFQLNRTKKGGGGGETAVTELQGKNLAFVPPADPWAEDKKLQKQLGVPILIVYSRANPDAHMAFGAREYTDREPRPTELRAGLDKPVNALFEDVIPSDIPDAKWLGQPAVAFAFRARDRADGESIVGECHAVSYKGMAYWSVCWVGENDAKEQAAAFDATRQSFKLLAHRETWRPQVAPTKPFRGNTMDYQVLDAEGIWSEPNRAVTKLEDLDAKADLYLVAREKRKGSDFSDQAELLALVLPDRTGEPLDEAVQYVKEKLTKELKEGNEKQVVTFRELTGDPVGNPANPIDPTAPVARFLVETPGASSTTRVAVVSAIRMDKAVVAVFAWCPVSERPVYEAKLVQIAGSLRSVKE